VRLDLFRVAGASTLALVALVGGKSLMGLDWFTAMAFAAIVLIWGVLALALTAGDSEKWLRRAALVALVARERSAPNLVAIKAAVAVPLTVVDVACGAVIVNAAKTLQRKAERIEHFQDAAVARPR
jgi:hypothetical protein